MKTKLLCLLAMLIIACSPVLAQTPVNSTGSKPNKTVIAFGPSLWSPTFKFEQGIGKSVSLGFHGKARFIIWEGGKIEPFFRYYFSYKAPEGAYLQLKGSFGAYRRNFTWDDCYYDLNGNYVCDNYDENFFRSYGGGLAGGYQFFLGSRDRFALDLFGGFQYIRQEGSRYSDYNFFRRIFINFPVELGFRMGVAF